MSKKSIGMQLSLFEGGETPVELLPDKPEESEVVNEKSEEVREELPGQLSMFESD